MDTRFKEYKRKGTTWAMPWEPGFDMAGVSVSDADRVNGSPMAGDMIAMNIKNPKDKWLVAEKYFQDNLEPV